MVRGIDQADGSSLFYGIPYATPPVGPRRWQPPAKVAAWRGVRDASKPPAPCKQLDEGWNSADAASSSEDCLYLSIHSPRHDKGARLPVLVWMHGGSNRAGSGFGTAASPIHRKDIVVVGIEYRLGIFGFLATPALRAESDHRSAGNYALLDQIAALRWIKENISAFGGDPARVTIAGQSAGAVDVGALMRSPLAHGLFAQVIQESGALGAPRSAEQNEAIGVRLLDRLKLGSDARGLEALRSTPADKLLREAVELFPAGQQREMLWIDATADGWIIPKGANNLYGEGEQARVPSIIGTNTQEIGVDLDADQTIGLIRGMFGMNADAALKLYGMESGTAPPADPIFGSVSAQVLTDVAFRCPAERTVAIQVAQDQKVWRYEFGVPEPGAAGVAHNAELKYVFGERPSGATAGTWPPVQDYWANFIRTGDPDGPGLPHWPKAGKGGALMAFTPDGPQSLVGEPHAPCRLLMKAAR